MNFNYQLIKLGNGSLTIMVPAPRKSDSDSIAVQVLIDIMAGSAYTPLFKAL